MSLASDEPNDDVGPVLEASAAGRAVLAAILEENQAVHVLDRGAYLRVLVPRRCVVSRATIERTLGRNFRLPADLEPLMPSFRGLLSVSADHVAWSFERR